MKRLRSYDLPFRKTLDSVVKPRNDGKGYKIALGEAKFKIGAGVYAR
jgi:hypothetical protein